MTDTVTEAAARAAWQRHSEYYAGDGKWEALDEDKRAYWYSILSAALPIIVAGERARTQEMHRRAQLAEGRLERAKWWIDAGTEWCRNQAMKDKIWPVKVPRRYIEEAAAAIRADTGGE